jgi:hypothetical protein
MKIVFRFKDKKKKTFFRTLYTHSFTNKVYITKNFLILIVTSLSLMVGDRDTDCLLFFLTQISSFPTLTFSMNS